MWDTESIFDYKLFLIKQTTIVSTYENFLNIDKNNDNNLYSNIHCNNFYRKIFSIIITLMINLVIHIITSNNFDNNKQWGLDKNTI